MRLLRVDLSYSRNRNRHGGEVNLFSTSSTVGRIFIAAAISCGIAAGQTKNAAVNFSGYWRLQDDSRNVPRAKLTAQAAALNQDELRKHDMQEIRWCHWYGIPYLMGTSPLQIAQNRTGREIAIIFTTRNPTRHIYLDRPHPNSETLDATSVGNSVAKWEGDTLVADTIAFSEEGLTAIPGGGRRTKTSHLVERFRLLRDGNQLSVVSAWTDPNTFREPHTYEFRYFRIPTKAFELPNVDCDPADEARARFLLNPPGTQPQAAGREGK
jgi:hypothetical protein